MVRCTRTQPLSCTRAAGGRRERGGLVPSLKQFMELVEFYAFQAREDLPAAERRALRYQAVAAMVRALALPAYHVTGAFDLIARLQPEAPDRTGNRTT